MGLCLSRCGEAQHKAAVVAVTISHHGASSPARPSRCEAQDHSHSLKRFLHMYNDDSESRKVSTASLRPSLDGSFAIPHSSELFSLPSEGLGSDLSRSPSPARGSMSSVRRSSTSCIPHSPKSKNSDVAPLGRFSTDIPPIAPKGSAKKVPARKSCSSLGQPANSPYMNLVETIARLENFCDVKLFLKKRSSTIRDSSPDLSSCAQRDSVQLHDSCRDLAQKLLCFANEHAYQSLHDSSSTRRCDSAGNPKESEVRVDSHSVEGGLKDRTLPLEMSVECFLKEVENFISKVDAVPQTPLRQPDMERRVESVNCRPSSLEFQDADDRIQFTDFEATFELRPELTKITTSNHGLVDGGRTDNATQDNGNHQVNLGSTSALRESENAAPLVLRNPAHRHSRTTSAFDGTHPVSITPRDNQRSALSEISSNVNLAHDSLARENHLLTLRTRNGPKKDVAHSFDSQDHSVFQMEFIELKKERCELLNETYNLTEANGVANLSIEKTQEGDAEDPTNQRLLDEVKASTSRGNAAPPSMDIIIPDLQPTKEETSASGGEQESGCAEDTLGRGDILMDFAGLEGSDAGLLDDDSDNSLSIAFDNLLKILQSPSGELAQNTSDLLGVLAGQLDTRGSVEFCAEGSQFLDDEGTALEAHVDEAQAVEVESWHDAPASLSFTSELPGPS
ncbi:uncharacterized protein [Physcomitrium patens]|uniref:Uncharacterized protein n=1 Tax=Physcomitrium patens TaxID=3218 RepID=A0A2K1IW46_PHYPA|nr:uncharacterized protein LOC112273094 [Physcomitrium patens]PNR33502.1 hypothetical protein PHYPA_025446 [Physcomitrium patens]|eukprot:XP_024357251.1 uncharacterized protein LOC112273094 [Physcomitrella patens]